MPDLNESQYQELMKPFFDIIKGIVKIVSEDSQEKVDEKSNFLIDQIMLSTSIMFLSQVNKGDDIPTPEEIGNKIKEGKSEEVFSSLTEGISPEDLTKYMSESTTLIMTNYYFETKDLITPEKQEQIQKLYEKISEKV